MVKHASIVCSDLVWKTCVWHCIWGLQNIRFLLKNVQTSSEKCSTLIWKMFSSPLKNPSLTLHMELLKRSGLAWKILRPHLKNIQTSPEKCSALVWKPTRLTLHASSGKCSDNDNENLGFWNNVIASLVPIKTFFSKWTSFSFSHNFLLMESSNLKIRAC